MADQRPSRPDNNPAEAGEPKGPGAKRQSPLTQGPDFEESIEKIDGGVYRVKRFTKGPRKGDAERTRLDGPGGTLPEGVTINE